jgi:hypothetical protein
MSLAENTLNVNGNVAVVPAPMYGPAMRVVLLIVMPVSPRCALKG